MKRLFVMVVLTVCVYGMTAQTTDKNLLGVWLAESMQYDGERKIVCGDEAGFVTLKYYGEDGEYACVFFVRGENGEYLMQAHEYGTYTYKNGVYSEMGRPAGGPDALVMVDKNTFKGRWFNRSDVWKKQNNMSKKLLDFILETLRREHQISSTELQNLIRRDVFRK